MKKKLTLMIVTACTLFSVCVFSAPTPVPRIQIDGLKVVPEGKMWKVSGLTPYVLEKGPGTSDFYVDGQIWVGDAKEYNISGNFEVLINRRQDYPIWILGGSTVHRGDSRESFDVEEYPQER